MISIAGIDPGVSGGIGFLSAEGIATTAPMPVIPRGKTKTVNPYVLSDLLWDHKPKKVIIEQVGAMPGQGVTSMFNFGYGAGVLFGVCACLGCKVEFVSPVKWKKDLGLSKHKGASRDLATRLYPECAKDFVRVKDDGVAEGLLMAHWYRVCC